MLSLHFGHGFSGEMFLMLYSINWPNFIPWLPLLHKISINMCIIIVCYPVCDVTNVHIYFSDLIKPFSYMTKKSEQKFKYLKNEKSF